MFFIFPLPDSECTNSGIKLMIYVYSTNPSRLLVKSNILIIRVFQKTKILLKVLFPLLVTDYHTNPSFGEGKV